MQLHLKNLTETYSELAMIGETVNEEEKVIQLLAFLPDEYSTLVTALETCGQVPSWATVAEKLNHEENKVKNQHNNQTRALATQRQQCDQENASYSSRAYGSRNHEAPATSKKSFTCHHCHKPGHIKKLLVFKEQESRQCGC